MDAYEIKNAVRQRYGRLAKADGCCGTTDCCSPEGTSISLVDYGQLGDLVEPVADLGLGCGTPTLHAGLRLGQVVLDLGSGAGIDVFLAARQVGPEGRVIGVDMTPQMIERARANAQQAGYGNVEFRLGEIEALPVETGSVDVVISNCVLNLVPDKARAFAEIWRVLRPGGRLCVSDIVTHGRLPEEMRQDVDLWTGCLAGAVDQDDYLALIRDAGFQAVQVKEAREYNEPDRGGLRVASITVETSKP